MNYMYSISAADLSTIYPEAIELAKQHGKKVGEDFGEEFNEVAKKYNIKLNCLGSTEMDAGLITGNLREEGLKVLNINEEMEKRNNNE